MSAQVRVFVPGPLRVYCDGATELPVAAGSVRAALEQIAREYPALHRNVRDETGAVRRHINVFVNSDNVRDLEGLETTVREGDLITILPAVSGG